MVMDILAQTPEHWWKVLEENVLEPFDTPDQRQKETKELVTGFALYYVGDKLGSELSAQRKHLEELLYAC